MMKALEDSSWTPEAADVLIRACEHYGGIAAWDALRRIRLIPDRLSGLVPWLKGAGRTFTLPVAFDIFPHERRARFLEYPEEDHVGVFDKGNVRLERLDGSVVAKSDDHRQSFHGLAKSRRWTPLDALYFFGYALTHYHSLPFSLLQARLIRARAAATGREPLEILEVELPADLPTHCRRQCFYFNEIGCLTRHDYHAEIVGFWARGAHFWNRQVFFNGFPISMDRRVVARVGSTPVPMLALHATFLDAEVEFAPSGTAADNAIS
jgi:hypothetical protein